MLSLSQATQYLKIHHHILLRCVKLVARPNGGIKLVGKDVNGDLFFEKHELDAFNEDLYQPWVDSSAADRATIPSYFKDVLRAESLYKCALCGSLYATEYAHIEPWALCLHNHPRNLVCLCSRCHTGYDIEKRITRAEVQAAKDRVEEQTFKLLLNERILMPEECTTFKEMCYRIVSMFAQNRQMLFSFGPASALGEEGRPEAAEMWSSARSSVVVPNNRAVASILRSNRHLYSGDPEFVSAANEFIVHSESYAQFVLKTNSTHEFFPFPVKFAELVEKGAV